MAEELESNGGYGALLDWLDVGGESCPIDPLIPGTYSGHEDLWDAALPGEAIMETAPEGNPEARFFLEPSFSSNDSAAAATQGGDAESFWAQPTLGCGNVGEFPVVLLHKCLVDQIYLNLQVPSIIPALNDVGDSGQAAKKRKKRTGSLDGKNSTPDQSTKGRRSKALENNATSPQTGESAHHDSHYLTAETKLMAGSRSESEIQPDSDPAGNNSNHSSNNNSNKNNKGKFGGHQINPPAQPKESRWAEQLLNPCAVAIATNNVFRIQHLIWVLHDLASASGDANHRLASYGLKALTAKITRVEGSLPCSEFLCADPRLFHRALLKFHEVSPWYELAYTIANGALLEAFEDQSSETVHVIDIGVSHGIQWPTFIEALARRSAGPPSLLRLTVVADTLGAPFSSGPASNDYSSRLERFAKSLNLNMELKIIAQPLDSLTMETLGVKENEALAICTQFRLHQLLEETNTDKNDGEDGLSPRDRFIKFARELNPIVFVLSDNDADHSSPDFLTRFQQSVDHLWRFLDSTSVCFRGRECEERRMVEGEAAMALVNNAVCEGACRVERNENHLKWGTRVKEGGFVSEMPSDEIMENARALLRKHDSNWEMRLEDECVSLCWKNHPISFCSVWKP
eukprot:Gb_39436 [translate_table: standard]